LNTATLTLEDEVLQQIRDLRPHYIELLQELVRISSTFGREAAAQAVMVREMERLGLEVASFDVDVAALKDHPGFNNHGQTFKNRPNVVGRWRGTGQGRSLILNAHIDMAPIGHRRDWSAEPLSARVEGNILFGRGAWDDKAGCVQLLWITEALQRAGVKLGGDLLLQSVIEDESTANGTLATFQKGHVADGAVILDGTHANSLIYAHMGQQMFEVTFQGKSVPSCVSFRGYNPVFPAMRFVEGCRQLQDRLNRERNGEPWGECPEPNFVCVGRFDSGSGPWSVPPKCVIQGQFGFTPPHTLAQAQEELRELVRQASDNDLWLAENPPELRFFGYSSDPFVGDPDNPLIEALVEQVQRLRGFELRKRLITGACDLRHMVDPATGKAIPCCMYGPGRGANAHVPNEYVDLDEVEQVAENVAALALRWCSASK
jgi:acetylornithine deacetylase